MGNVGNSRHRKHSFNSEKRVELAAATESSAQYEQRKLT